ncbi:MAG TPA: LON peptidase substrate-binding domain-containing protein [Candidatus Polarisedimenticolia bacterium]|nr:LON peptidase substrate-binding domain-containing protein [Candidatus Polarisedimenticolia bacterium]
MSELIPLFPLGAVLFPGALMPLHIFEPRYRLLVRRCIERQRPFGIVLIRSGSEVGAGAEPYEVGTEAKIVAESPLPDGRSYIVTRGERRFVVESLIADAEPYLMGKVRFLDETDGDRAIDRAGVAREALGAYLLAVVAVTEDARGERALVNDLRNAPPCDLAYRIAGSLAVDAPQQQALLELDTASARLEEETRILNRETELLRDLLVRLRERGERPELN